MIQYYDSLLFIFCMLLFNLFSFFFFFNDTATTEIYTLSLHDALPIYGLFSTEPDLAGGYTDVSMFVRNIERESDRKSTRLNSSHLVISYAVFCLKKKKKTTNSLRFHQ